MDKTVHTVVGYRHYSPPRFLYRSLTLRTAKPSVRYLITLNPTLGLFSADQWLGRGLDARKKGWVYRFVHRHILLPVAVVGLGFGFIVQLKVRL